MIKKIIATIMGLGINIVIYAVAIFVLIRVGTIAYDFSRTCCIGACRRGSPD